MKVLVLLLMVVLGISACKAKKDSITITTGSVGGTYFPVGGAIAQLLTDHMTGLTVNSEVGNASIANCKLIANGETDTALVQNNVAYWAYHGLEDFENQPVDNLRALATLYPEAIQIIVTENSGIKRIEDLKGKRVSLGVEGSGSYRDAINVLEAYEMDEKDLVASYLSFEDASEQMIDGVLDAVFATSGYPTASISNISLNKTIRVLPLEESKIKAIVDTSPFYAMTVIPAGTYTGQENEVKTVTTMALWVADESLPEALVYDMLKVFWDNIYEIEAAHVKGEVIDINKALNGISIPLHPGAVKYYNEIGIK